MRKLSAKDFESHSFEALQTDLYDPVLQPSTSHNPFYKEAPKSPKFEPTAMFSSKASTSKYTKPGCDFSNNIHSKNSSVYEEEGIMVFDARKPSYDSPRQVSVLQNPNRGKSKDNWNCSPKSPAANSPYKKPRAYIEDKYRNDFSFQTLTRQCREAQENKEKEKKKNKKKKSVKK